MTRADDDTSGSRPGAPPPERFERLARSGANPRGQVGCLFLLGGPLFLFGTGLVALFFLHPDSKSDDWIMALVGGAFGGVGFLLLIAAVKGWRSLGIPWTELAVAPGMPLHPGQTARLRLRQPGPVALRKLTVTLLCERVYRRRVSSKSSSTVEDQERLWEESVLEIRDTRVREGKGLERERDFHVPADARPTGPAQPDGRIRWRMEVIGQAGFMRGSHHPFDIEIAATAGTTANAPARGGGHD